MTPILLPCCLPEVPLSIIVGQNQSFILGGSQSILANSRYLGGNDIFVVFKRPISLASGTSRDYSVTFHGSSKTVDSDNIHSFCSHLWAPASGQAEIKLVRNVIGCLIPVMIYVHIKSWTHFLFCFGLYFFKDIMASPFEGTNQKNRCLNLIIGPFLHHL